MGKAERKTKNTAMAAAMKADKVVRTRMACPVCHATVSLTNQTIGSQTLYGHMLRCGGHYKGVS